jgi:hypothetical protein
VLGWAENKPIKSAAQLPDQAGSSLRSTLYAAKVLGFMIPPSIEMARI